MTEIEQLSAALKTVTPDSDHIAVDVTVKVAHGMLVQEGAAIGDGTFLQRLLELILKLLPIILEIFRGGGQRV